MLVAVSIPIFTNQLEKSREATDAANIRSAYAEVQACALTEEAGGNATVTGSGDSLVVTEKVKLKQQKAGWQTAPEFPANLTGGTSQPTGVKDQEVTITYTASTGVTAIDIALTKAS